MNRQTDESIFAPGEVSRVLLLLAGIICFTSIAPYALFAAELPPDVDLPLQYRTPHQRVLLIHRDAEANVSVEACKANGLKYEVQKGWDIAAQDYSGVHTMIAGSNFMDRFRTEIGRKPESFEPIARFVRDGGHLFLYGTYNGRYSQHLQQFGIKTGIYHGKTFVPVPDRAEALFDGFSGTIPDFLQIVCNLAITVDHVSILKRGAGHNIGSPFLATLKHGKGRVSILPCEPNWRKEYWIMPVVIRWIANGAPTSLRQKGQTTLLSERLSRVTDTSLPLITDERLKEAEEDLKTTFSNSYQRATDIAGKESLAQKLSAHTLKEISDLEKVASLRQAAIFFASVADVENALAALSDRAGIHQLNEPAEQADLLAQAAKNLSTIDECVEVATVALNLSEDAEDLLEFAAAASLAQTAETAGTRSRKPSLIRLAKNAVKRLRRFRFEADWVEDHTQKLGTTTAGKSSSAIGRFYCLMVENWETGLPYLRAGDDQTLRELVELEVSAGDDVVKQEAVGDHWLKFARTAPTLERQSAARRASFWFRQCLAKVSQEAFSEAAVSRIEQKMKTFARETLELKVKVRLAGSAEIKVSADKLEWILKSGDGPHEVVVDGINWNIAESPALTNRGSTRYLPRGTTIDEVSVKRTRGRSIVSVEKADGGFTVKLRSLSTRPDELEFELHL